MIQWTPHRMARADSLTDNSKVCEGPKVTSNTPGNGSPGSILPIRLVSHSCLRHGDLVPLCQIHVLENRLELAVQARNVLHRRCILRMHQQEYPPENMPRRRSSYHDYSSFSVLVRMAPLADCVMHSFQEKLFSWASL